MSINNQKGLIFPTCFTLVTFARDVITYFALYSSFLLFNVLMFRNHLGICH